MCIGIFLPPHVVPICIVTYILPIPLPAAYLLKWLLKQGTQQQPLRLCAQTFEKLMLAVPGECQRFKSNFFMLTLSPKLLSHVLFSASLKENTEMPFSASSVMDGSLLTGRLRAWQF